MNKINMNKIKKIILIELFLLVFPLTSLASDITVKIDIAKEFLLGERIYFDYNLFSTISKEVILFPGVRCEKGLSMSSREIFIKKLEAGKIIKLSYYGRIVSEDIEPQTCTAYVQILSPIQKTVEKQFKIKTNPVFEFNINFCKDSLCLEKSKTFVKGSNVYLNYSSEITNPNITASLIYPDKSISRISLPAVIKPEQIGTYTLEVTVSKSGYKTITKKEQFAVIEKQPKYQEKAGCKKRAYKTISKVSRVNVKKQLEFISAMILQLQEKILRLQEKVRKLLKRKNY